MRKCTYISPRAPGRFLHYCLREPIDSVTIFYSIYDLAGQLYLPSTTALMLLGVCVLELSEYDWHL